MARTIGWATLGKLRTRYRAMGRDWPFENYYLGQLWAEARAATEQLRCKVPAPRTWEFALDLMRECDALEPAA